MLNGNYFDDYRNADRRIISVIYRKEQHTENVWRDTYDFGNCCVGWFRVEFD